MGKIERIELYHVDEGKLRRWGKRYYVATPFRLAVRTILDKGLSTALELEKKKEQAAGGGEPAESP